jgi:hypothetical protein
MNKWYKYTLALADKQGDVHESVFEGGALEIIGGRFFQIAGTPEGTILLNFDVVAQLNFVEVK